MVRDIKPRRKSVGELRDLKDIPGRIEYNDKETEEARRRKRSCTWP